jgi:hypothetical protein
MKNRALMLPKNGTAPLFHRCEDEFSFVREGTIGALLLDTVMIGHAFSHLSIIR